MGDGDFEPLATVPAGTVGYRDTMLPAATLITYRVRALLPAPHEDWSHNASATTFGIGLATWAAGFLIEDPYLPSAGGLAPVFAYLSGLSPTSHAPFPLTIRTENGNAFLALERAAGIYDVRAEIEEQTGPDQWYTLHEIGPDFPDGLSHFPLPPSEDGSGLFRLRLSPAP